jgi:hypothetical protein
MIATSDKNDVLSGLSQPPTKISSYTTRTKDCNAHIDLLN